ncbi:UDP-glucuronosyl/UDP-glucosyltransferase [Corchorus capsularis]|uniref:UDP-glucuronosyl/UDP-glucosyltransferase n=1 Tax=Corchorus capsularis TaxID=210143 RepID=A0A1R3K6H8_COCAP|nr:UDP-glucuronosyl/UDP-glucosyltransferase [Corchorus capsularis]
MGSYPAASKPHAVCIPYPAQGHINPILKLAKFLHHKGFHITFVHTDYNYKRLLRSRGPNSLDGLPDFQFKAIPDGLPPTDADSTQYIPSLCDSTSKTCLVPFRDLLHKLNHVATQPSSTVPPVSCIVSDGAMSFTVEAAQEFEIPIVHFWTPSACGFLCYVLSPNIVERGLTPVKDANFMTNGYLDQVLDWVPGMKNIRFGDLPSFFRTMDPNDKMFNYLLKEIENTKKASAIVLNTFDSLEQDVLDALSSMLPPVYSIGPLHLLADRVQDDELGNIGSNLWKEETECIEWLNSKEPNSVVYVNYGSITVMSPEQLIEFAWGLANTQKHFLWIIRPDLVAGETAILPPEFVSETKNRGMLASWCPQEQVLKQPSIGVFLSHMGWNSTLESLCCGVPMICWPFFAEQQLNCLFACREWGVGLEIDTDVKRDKVEKLVREVLGGEKGVEMKAKAMEWKKKAEEATSAGGSSFENMEKLVRQVLQS